MKRLLCILALVAACTACGSEPQVLLKGERFTVEVADTADTRALGLMFRRSLPEDQGMLFIFPDEAPRSFWMKNTYIPLDILYFDRARRLVAMQEKVLPCAEVNTTCPGYPSGHAAQYVLELNAGTARRLGLERGDVLEISLPERRPAY